MRLRALVALPATLAACTRATIPATINGRALQKGDVVNVVVKAGGLQREFRYRIAALPQDPAKRRVLVVAAEDYTGVSPNVQPGCGTASRHLRQHVSALAAAGYEVEVFDVDAPPENGGTRTGSCARRSSTRPISACSRTSTPSTGTPATTSRRRTRARPTRAT